MVGAKSNMDILTCLNINLQYDSCPPSIFFSFNLFAWPFSVQIITTSLSHYNPVHSPTITHPFWPLCLTSPVNHITLGCVWGMVLGILGGWCIKQHELNYTACEYMYFHPCIVTPTIWWIPVCRNASIGWDFGYTLIIQHTCLDFRWIALFLKS